jgi:hypothetical protein
MGEGRSGIVGAQGRSGHGRHFPHAGGDGLAKLPGEDWIDWLGETQGGVLGKGNRGAQFGSQ